MRKPDKVALTQSVGGSPVDAAFQRAYPVLFEWMTEVEWEGGAAREPLTLILMTEGPAFKACVNDRANERLCWVVASTLTGLLQSVESVLKDEGTDWKPAKLWGARKKGGK